MHPICVIEKEIPKGSKQVKYDKYPWKNHMQVVFLASNGFSFAELPV